MATYRFFLLCACVATLVTHVHITAFNNGYATAHAYTNAPDRIDLFGDSLEATLEQCLRSSSVSPHEMLRKGMDIKLERGNYINNKTIEMYAVEDVSMTDGGQRPDIALSGHSPEPFASIKYTDCVLKMLKTSPATPYELRERVIIAWTLGTRRTKNWHGFHDAVKGIGPLKLSEHRKHTQNNNGAVTYANEFDVFDYGLFNNGNQVALNSQGESTRYTVLSDSNTENCRTINLQGAQNTVMLQQTRKALGKFAVQEITKKVVNPRSETPPAQQETPPAQSAVSNISPWRQRLFFGTVALITATACWYMYSWLKS